MSMTAPWWGFNHHNHDNDDTLARLERRPDEPLASQFLPLWQGWSCKHDDYDVCDDHYDYCYDWYEYCDDWYNYVNALITCRKTLRHSAALADSTQLTFEAGSHWMRRFFINFLFIVKKTLSLTCDDDHHEIRITMMMMLITCEGSSSWRTERIGKCWRLFSLGSTWTSDGQWQHRQRGGRVVLNLSHHLIIIIMTITKSSWSSDRW